MKSILFFVLVLLLIGIVVLCSFSHVETFEDKFENKLSLLSMFKNETMTMKTWLEHYVKQGVEQFYLIDNGSEDNPLEILQPYIDNGLVKYYYMPEKHKQEDRFRELIEIENLRKKTEWLIICDLDEFFYGYPNKLITTLDEFSGRDIIYCFWRMFGTDGHEKHPENILKSIVWRTPNEDKAHIKYIFKPSKVHDLKDITLHQVANLNNAELFNDKIRLNHYPLQSLEFYQKVKMTRGDAYANFNENIRNMEYFEKYNDNMIIKDDVLANMS